MLMGEFLAGLSSFNKCIHAYMIVTTYRINVEFSIKTSPVPCAVTASAVSCIILGSSIPCGLLNY